MRDCITQPCCGVALPKLGTEAFVDLKILMITALDSRQSCRSGLVHLSVWIQPFWS